MAKKVVKEVKESKKEKRSESITVYASPSWQLKRIGNAMAITSPSGFFPFEKEGLVQVKITVEE